MGHFMLGDQQYAIEVQAIPSLKKASSKSPTMPLQIPDHVKPKREKQPIIYAAVIARR